MYNDTDLSQLRRDADSCLLKYGTEFQSDLIVGAKGPFIYTSSGHRMLDWTSGQMSCLIGHGHPEVVQTITDHASNLDHVFSGMLTPPPVKLGKLLTSLLPNGLDRAMFLSTGGESNECAIRLAKVFTGKFEIVGMDASWHGMTGAASGAQYHVGRKGAGPVMPGNFCLPAPHPYRSIFRHPDGTHDWKTELDYGFAQIDKASCGSLAAVIVEPILSSGGILPLPKDYLRALKSHCEAREMLLIVDEAQTGIGRAGDMFAFQHDDPDLVPDILTLSKTLGNGLPLSAVVTSHRIAKVCDEQHFLFYTTHVNDPLPTAVGLRVLEVVLRDGLVEKARNLGFRLQAGLRKLQSRYGCIGDVRGRGLMAGVEIVRDRETKEGDLELAFAISNKMAKLGLWAQLATMLSFGGVFRMAPPIITTQEQIDKGLEIMEEAFSSTPGSIPLYETRAVL